MEEERSKIREPFDPEKTPGPPQQIDPDNANKKRTPGREEEKPGGPASSRNEEKNNPHLLNEDSGIDDETTI